MTRNFATLALSLFLFFSATLCQGNEAPPAEPILHEKPSQTPQKVEVNPQTKDEEIKKRLEEILTATGWFSKPQVSVDNGVVFLLGETKNSQFKDWACDLAHNTQDVTAVVNKISVSEPSIWDLHMILHELKAQARRMLRSLPGVLIATVILFIFWMLARFIYRLIPHLFRNTLNPSLVREVIARAISILVFTIGVYFIFEMSDLTGMAVTVISGTGLIGIILGIAFRDITENFLASVLLSVQQPFNSGDLVDIVSSVNGYAVTGYIERLTLRVTILILLDGTSLQIPNSTVYKSNIRNYSTNPNHREDFVIPIGTNCSVSKAILAVESVLTESDAILKDPEPLVLVDEFSKDQIGLHLYYWVDARKHNWLKVKSSVIRLIKQVFQDEDIDYQGESSPEMHNESAQTQSETKSHADSPIDHIKGLSPIARSPEQGKNLLGPKEDPPKE